MATAARYHIGTVAFGGFIVAVIQFVRLLLEYLDRKTKKFTKRNAAARWAVCCCRCLLWCDPLFFFASGNKHCC